VPSFEVHTNSPVCGRMKKILDTDATGFLSSEPIFLNVYGAQESIPRNEFRQPM
jgi:hypothetical protein